MATDRTMMERVARAMCAPRYGVSWESIGPETREYLMYDARAAIEAMREPSNAMLQAWADADTQSAIENYGRGLDVETGWDIGIDAALKETP